ncbi:MAG TPA: glycerophosphodiester phosphodiesterase family protein [Microbacterium sp.]|uniref:glycerophosphodiester phosphodiesterase family protein n=1 Tax=Microbacterium sp. TaxID=51671 RepID=UPI002B487664|nr:glycerophosphodiester phosphodiesterase family protein [Microbacterium sp.]HKT57979.1 glycerophosphodiester phosphodiesterase family protein [Microbacterium sp.]
MSRARPLIIGHRGAPGFRPEHTRSSYDLAIQQGADAVEPDVVVSRDGVLVVRHDVELSETTDVASRPEFADRRATRTVDGARLTGWFCEDFAWEELATLTARERIPRLRPQSARYDGQQPILRLRDLLALLDAADRPVVPVIEVKHPTYLAAAGFDLAELLDAELHAAGWADGRRPLVIESFETTVLGALQARGIPAEYVALLEASGSAPDTGMPYDEATTDAGLDRLAGQGIGGISVAKETLLRAGGRGLVERAHARGMRVFTWTLRPENAFLDPRFRRGADAAAFGDYPGEWAAIRDTGVDAVFVDHPDLGRDVFG